MKITLDNISDVYRAGRASIDMMQFKGYTLVHEQMVNNSGLGGGDEYADTPDQFDERLNRLLGQHGTLTAKITGVGQFQVYVGLFKKTSNSIVKKIANNTLLIDYPDRRVIRLHDTDILIEKNGRITINMGGWDTLTTRERIDRYLPNGWCIIRHKGESYLIKRGKDYAWPPKSEYKPFKEGMSVRGKLNIEGHPQRHVAFPAVGL